MARPLAFCPLHRKMQADRACAENTTHSTRCWLLSLQLQKVKGCACHVDVLPHLRQHPRRRGGSQLPEVLLLHLSLRAQHHQEDREQDVPTSEGGENRKRARNDATGPAPVVIHPPYSQVDDVLGGSAAWENVDSTDAVCPRCEHGRAFFMQIQTRSADEPMTTFYKCCKPACGHRWKD